MMGRTAKTHKIGKKRTLKKGQNKAVLRGEAKGIDRITVVDDDGHSHQYPKKIIDIMGHSFSYNKTLGQGGFGHVLLYKNGNDTRAVKFYRYKDDMTMEKTNYEKLSRFPAIRQYIPTYYGSISKNDTYHGIILEKLEFDLYTLEKKKHTLSFRQIYDLLREIINCLTEFHKAGVCINDLKPENMMIKHTIRKGKKIPRLYVIDLCLTSTQLPNSHHCHTTQFDPPYVKVDNNKCRPQNDIWNFGVICFIFFLNIEWKTLQRDYEGSTLKQVVNNPYTSIEIDNFITDSQYNKSQKKWLKTLFQGVLNNDESKRWNASKSSKHFKKGRELLKV